MQDRFFIHEVNYTIGKPNYFVYDREDLNWGQLFNNKYRAQSLCNKLNLKYNKALSKEEKDYVNSGIAKILAELQ